MVAQLPSLRKPAVGSTMRYPDNVSTSADVLLGLGYAVPGASAAGHDGGHHGGD